MASLTISVPVAVKEWVDGKVRDGEYESSGDYLVDLIERDRAQSESDEEIEELRRIVDEATASGISDRTVDDIFNEAVERARANGRLRD
jgi:antitoxin ParD1/3/4